jgi:hypothetical protein
MARHKNDHILQSIANLRDGEIPRGATVEPNSCLSLSREEDHEWYKNVKQGATIVDRA